MTSSTTDAADAYASLRELVLAARDLAEQLDAAEAVQWLPAPRPRSHAPRSAPSTHSDPTAAVALQPERLGVRAAVGGGNAALRAALANVRRAEREVATALVAWEGHAVPH